MSRRELVQGIIGGLVVMATLGIMLAGIWDVNLRYMLASTLNAPSPAPTLPPLAATPGSDLAALQQVVETQQAQIDTLTRDLNNFKEDQAKRDMDIRWSLDSKLFVAGALASLAALLGFGAYNSIEEKVRQKVRASLDETLLGYDPAYVPVYFPKGKEHTALLNRLKAAWLKNIRPYAENGLTPNPGITVVMTLTDDQDNDFIKFLQRAKAANDLDADEMVFILYTGTHRIDSKKYEQLMTVHPNLTTANTPVTLVSHIFNAGRGLRGERPKEIRSTS